MKTVYLVCGVPGSGKTWLCEQVADKLDFLAHDDFPVSDYHKAIKRLAEFSDKPVLAEAPFRVSVLADQLRAEGVEVKEYWVIESDAVTKARYEQRMGKPFPNQHSSNLRRYEERTRGLSTRGTSSQVLEMLR